MSTIQSICKFFDCQPGAILSYEKEIDKNSILYRLREEKDMKLKGGLYHQTQIRLAYNSNHMEGSRLTEEQTRSIYETHTIGVTEGYEKIDDIIDFHYRFEKIHPFQDGNGRVGRLILFKECLKYNISPFIIEDVSKEYYKRGLNEYVAEKGYLLQTCRTAQDTYKKLLEYFEYI